MSPRLVPREREDRVWVSAREIGSGGTSLSSLGTSTVAILAGFDLAAVALLKTNSSSSGWTKQGALGCFGVSAALFILALALIATAEDYSVPPDLRLTYNPEAQVSLADLDRQRLLQRQDEYLIDLYSTRINFAVNFAVLGVLGGLALLLCSNPLSAGAIVAASASVIIAVLTLVDFWKQGTNEPGWTLFPRPHLPEETEEEVLERYGSTCGMCASRQEKRLDQARRLRSPSTLGPLDTVGVAAVLGSRKSTLDDWKYTFGRRELGALFDSCLHRLLLTLDGLVVSAESIVLTVVTEGSHVPAAAILPVGTTTDCPIVIQFAPSVLVAHGGVVSTLHPPLVVPHPCRCPVDQSFTREIYVRSVDDLEAIPL